MHFAETRLTGAFVIDLDPLADQRGFFARTYCAREFEEHGLRPVVAQCNVSFNHRQGTLRGMHYQVPPSAETKLVRCTTGAIFDVIVDLRDRSPTYGVYVGVELTADNRRALYIPESVAHGFQTLVDNTEVEYLMGDFYRPVLDQGVRYDDPSLDIRWPLPVSVIAEKDTRWPLLDTLTRGAQRSLPSKDPGGLMR